MTKYVISCCIACSISIDAQLKWAKRTSSSSWDIWYLIVVFPILHLALAGVPAAPFQHHFISVLNLIIKEYTEIMEHQNITRCRCRASALSLSLGSRSQPPPLSTWESRLHVSLDMKVRYPLIALAPLSPSAQSERCLVSSLSLIECDSRGRRVRKILRRRWNSRHTMGVVALSTAEAACRAAAPHAAMAFCRPTAV